MTVSANYSTPVQVNGFSHPNSRVGRPKRDSSAVRERGLATIDVYVALATIAMRDCQINLPIAIEVGRLLDVRQMAAVVVYREMAVGEAGDDLGCVLRARPLVDPRLNETPEKPRLIAFPGIRTRNLDRVSAILPTRMRTPPISADVAASERTGESETMIAGDELETIIDEAQRQAVLDSYAIVDSDFEQAYGATTHNAYGMCAMRHMHDYGTTSEQLAWIKVAASHHAQYNPHAMLKDVVTVEDVLNSPMISDPLHRMDCCVVTDGGGALIVTTPEIARSRDSATRTRAEPL